MIRKSIPEDKEQVVELIKEFFEEYDLGAGFNREKVTSDFDLYICNENIFCMSLCDGEKINGFIASIVASRPFFGDKTSQELMWYVRKECRSGGQGIKLLKEFEKQCTALGCDNIIMFGIAGTKIEELYKKFGYKKTDSSYIKKLGG